MTLAGPALLVAALAFAILGAVLLVLRRSVNFYADNHVNRADPNYMAARSFKAKILMTLWVTEAVALSIAASVFLYPNAALTFATVLIAGAMLALYRNWPDMKGIENA